MTYQASTTRGLSPRIHDASITCLPLRYSCIVSCSLVRCEHSTQKRLIGSTCQFTLLVILLLLDFHCHSSLQGWWEVQSSLFQTSGPSGIKLMELTTFLLFHMILVHAFTIRWGHVHIFTSVCGTSSLLTISVLHGVGVISDMGFSLSRKVMPLVAITLRLYLQFHLPL